MNPKPRPLTALRYKRQETDPSCDGTKLLELVGTGVREVIHMIEIGQEDTRILVAMASLDRILERLETDWEAEAGTLQTSRSRLPARDLEQDPAQGVRAEGSHLPHPGFPANPATGRKNRMATRELSE